MMGYELYGVAWVTTWPELEGGKGVCADLRRQVSQWSASYELCLFPFSLHFYFGSERESVRQSVSSGTSRQELVESFYSGALLLIYNYELGLPRLNHYLTSS